VADPGTFTTLHIAITAIITAAIGLAVAWWRLRPTYPGEPIILAGLAGAAVFAWRLSANMPDLNNDGIHPFSANDWAAPILVYVALGCYASLRPPAHPRSFAQVRALLTIIALAVCVITI
jgi:hypothetical protein